MVFSFTKLENKRAEQVPSGRVKPVGRGEDVEKRCRRVNMVQIPHTPICKWKNDTY
jgi:hypothetical protein